MSHKNNFAVNLAQSAEEHASYMNGAAKLMSAEAGELITMREHRTSSAATCALDLSALQRISNAC